MCVPIDHAVESTQQIAARTLLVSRGSFTVPPPLYSPTFLERLYEKVSSADKAPRHEANHGSVHERFATRT